MDIDSTILLSRLIAMLIWGVVLGFLAKRKNRNPIGWGIAGAMSWLIAVLVLAFLPFLCPKCQERITKEEAKSDRCPHCNNGSDEVIAKAAS